MADPDAAVTAVHLGLLMPGKRPSGGELAASLEAITGHAFRDHALMQRALTHASAKRTQLNNERLEFLGDRVLGITVADMLFHAFPDAAEGELALRFNALVSGEACAEIASDIGLDQLIRAEATLKGRKAAGILADATEALVAAIYLEGGLEAARAFIWRYWQPRSQAVIVATRDPKSELQEWTARTNGSRPVYVVESRKGPDHEPVFQVSVAVEGFAPMTAAGRSKQAAERAAALAFLHREGVWTEDARA